MKKNSFNWRQIIFLVVVLLAIVGLVWSLPFFFRSYFLKSDYFISLIRREIDLSQYSSNREIVIQDAKKVVVNQDLKVTDTANEVAASLVAIFPKTESGVYYYAAEPLAKGVVLTNDGWILIYGRPTLSEKNFHNLVVVDNQRHVYEIDEINSNKKSNLIFLHVVAARDLHVRRFAAKNDLQPGQLVVNLNWEKNVFLTSVLGIKNGSEIRSSDVFSDSLLLAGQEQALKDSFVFNLSGDLIAMVDQNHNVEPVYHWSNLINDFLKNKQARRPSLGVNYLPLDEAVFPSKVIETGALISKNEKKSAIVKNSPAEQAGLAEGDVIIRVNNESISTNLSLTDLIQSHTVGGEIEIVYRRAGQEKKVKLKLSESL